MKEHKFHQAGPIRCRTCRARVNTHTRICTNGDCREPFVTSRYGSIGKARYEPEPEPPAPALALFIDRNYDDMPLGSAA